MALAKKGITQGSGILPAEKLTVGLPFYGRSVTTGEWKSYEDLVQEHHPLDPKSDMVVGQTQEKISFNGPQTIADKTRVALEAGIAGVMIWEVGQDCRLVPVTHGQKTHVRTCPP